MCVLAASSLIFFIMGSFGFLFLFNILLNVEIALTIHSCFYELLILIIILHLDNVQIIVKRSWRSQSASSFDFLFPNPFAKCP